MRGLERVGPTPERHACFLRLSAKRALKRKLNSGGRAGGWGRRQGFQNRHINRLGLNRTNVAIGRDYRLNRRQDARPLPVQSRQLAGPSQ